MSKWDRIQYLLICAYIIVLPIAPSKYSIHGIPLNGDVILAITILFFIISTIFQKRSRDSIVPNVKNFVKDFLGISMIILALMMLVSILYSPDKKLAIDESLRFISYVILFFILKYGIKNKQAINNILNTFLFVCVIISLLGVIQYFTGIGLPQDTGVLVRRRIESTLENANNLGAFAVIAFFPFLYKTIYERNKFKKFCFAFVTVLILLNVIFSFSRNAWIGFGIGFLLLTITYSIKFIFAIIAGGLISIFSPLISIRISEIASADQNISRINIWSIALRLIREHPIFGIGNGNFSVYYSKFIDIKNQTIEKHPHDALLKIQCELGILGSASFIVMLGSMFLKLKAFTKKVEDGFYKSFYKGFFISFIVFLSMNVVDNFFSAPKIVAFIWLLFGLSQGIEHNALEKLNVKE